MADVTISQLTRGTPTGNSLLPYSTGSDTLGVPVSGIFQTVSDNLFINSTPISIPGKGIVLSSNDPSGTSLFLNNQTLNKSWRIVSTGSNNTGGGTRFGIVNHTDDTNNYKLVILSGGEVGIGTNNPNATLDVNGSIRSSNGIPYNQRQAGSVTTDASGNARIYLSGWYWGDVTTYRRAMLIMFGIKNESVNYIGTWLGWFGGSTLSQLATSSQQGTNAVGVISVKDYSPLGQRWIDLASLPANTTFTYEIRSAAVGAGFMSSYGDF